MHSTRVDGYDYVLILLLTRNEFYHTFYGVFDDQFAVMDALLNGKESFSCKVNGVLRGLLSILPFVFVLLLLEVRNLECAYFVN